MSSVWNVDADTITKTVVWWPPKDNMEENSGGGAERNELQLEHCTTDAWRQADVEGFYHFPKCQRE